EATPQGVTSWSREKYGHCPRGAPDGRNSRQKVVAKVSGIIHLLSARSRSSAGQSTGFLNRGSQVRALPGSPFPFLDSCSFNYLGSILANWILRFATSCSCYERAGTAGQLLIVGRPSVPFRLSESHPSEPRHQLVRCGTLIGKPCGRGLAQPVCGISFRNTRL